MLGFQSGGHGSVEGPLGEKKKVLFNNHFFLNCTTQNSAYSIIVGTWTHIVWPSDGILNEHYEILLWPTEYFFVPDNK